MLHPGDGDHVIIGRYRDRLIARGDSCGNCRIFANFRFGADRARRQGDIDLIERD